MLELAAKYPEIAGVVVVLSVVVLGLVVLIATKRVQSVGVEWTKKVKNFYVRFF